MHESYDITMESPESTILRCITYIQVNALFIWRLYKCTLSSRDREA